MTEKEAQDRAKEIVDGFAYAELNDTFMATRTTAEASVAKALRDATDPPQVKRTRGYEVAMELYDRDADPDEVAAAIDSERSAAARQAAERVKEAAIKTLVEGFPDLMENGPIAYAIRALDTASLANEAGGDK